MEGQKDIDLVWDIIERIRVCMLTTRGPAGLRARPLEARLDREGKTIWFITDARSSKEQEIAADHEVGLAFIDNDKSIYLSITGSAEELRDRDTTASIWQATDKMWWDGPDDPNVSLLRFTPATAELWDGPSSKTIVAFEFLKSQITGAKPHLGENRKVTINMT
jgi:general stress protein 26